MTTQNNTQLIDTLHDLSVYDPEFTDRSLPYNEQDRVLVDRLVAIPTMEYILIDYEKRFDFSFVNLIEMVKGNGCRYKIRRDIMGSYMVRCFVDGIHFETICMDTYRDALTLINYHQKPHHTAIKAMKQHIKRLEESVKTDEDQAMAEGKF